MATPTGYVYGTHPEEQRRLSHLNALMNRASLDTLAPRAGEPALVNFRAGDALALPFGACAGEAVFPAYVANLAAVLDGARDAILATVAVSASAFAEAQAALRRWGERRDAVLWYTVSWAEAVKP